MATKTMRDHWQAMLTMLRISMDVSVLERYVQPLRLVKYEHGVLTVEATSEAQREYVALRLTRPLCHAMWMQTGQHITINCIREAGTS